MVFFLFSWIRTRGHLKTCRRHVLTRGGLRRSAGRIPYAVPGIPKLSAVSVFLFAAPLRAAQRGPQSRRFCGSAVRRRTAGRARFASAASAAQDNGSSRNGATRVHSIGAPAAPCAAGNGTMFPRKPLLLRRKAGAAQQGRGGYAAFPAFPCPSPFPAKIEKTPLQTGKNPL